MKIIIEKELEEWWGIDDLRKDYRTEPIGQESFHEAVISLLREDIYALLDGATWTVIDA